MKKRSQVIIENILVQSNQDTFQKILFTYLLQSSKFLWESLRIVFYIDAIQVLIFLLHITHVFVFFSELLSHISLTENDEL